jgi:hypothetical protein
MKSYMHSWRWQQYVVEYTLEQLEHELILSFFSGLTANSLSIRMRRCRRIFFNGRLSVKIHPLPQEQILVSKAKAPCFQKVAGSVISPRI